MAYIGLLIFPVLTVSEATPATVNHWCPAGDSAGSGMADPQQAVSVDCCAANDCIIKRVDTELEIVYATDSILVVTPKGKHNITLPK